MRCPFCKKDSVFVVVLDKEGNCKGLPGECDYELSPWSGLAYGLCHEGWGDCILCTDDTETIMGGVMFDTIEEAEDAISRCDV